MTVTTGLLISQGVAFFLLGVFFVSWLFRKDDKIEGRRKQAVETVPVLREMGLTWMEDIARDYAVGDYSGMAESLRTGFKFLTKKELVVSHFKDVLYKLLKYFVANDAAEAKRIKEEVLKLVP